MVKLNKHYPPRYKSVEKIKSLNTTNGYNNISSNNLKYIEDFSRGKLYEDLTQVEFNLLYPFLLIDLFEENLIEPKWKEDILRLKWFIENRKELKTNFTNEYQRWKTFSNSLYSKIKSPYVEQYLNLFYSDLINKYNDKILYIDVDVIILNYSKSEFQTKCFIPELNNFSYDIKYIDYFYAEDLQNYVKKEEGEITSRGFKGAKIQTIQALIKSEIRRRKLEKLNI
jgi:hypothetical protein